MVSPSANGYQQNTAAPPELLPPQSRETEKGVLGSMIRDNAVIPDVLDKLRSGDFYFDHHQKLFRTIAALHTAGTPVDTLTLFEELRRRKQLEDVGGAEYLAELWDAAPTSANWSYYADSVKGKAIARGVIHEATEAMRDAYDGVMPPAELADRLRQRVAELTAETESRSPWPAPKKASEVSRDAPPVDWLLTGLVAARHITLLSALMKSGKTTLLGYLLRAWERGESFLGLRTRPANVLYVSEETETVWAERIETVGIADHVSFIHQPFMAKPTLAEWVAFVDYLAGLLSRDRYDAIVIDTISNLWPVLDENDAAQVIAALMPLRKLAAAGPAVLPVHHLGKADLGEGKGARGSTGLPGFVDVLAELKRFKPTEPADRCRVITGWGRFREVPDELVVRLADDGRSYTVEGSRRQVRQQDARETLLDILPASQPGSTWDQIHEKWPEGQGWKKESVHAALMAGLGREFQRTGRGQKGDPHRYHRLTDSVPGVPEG